MQTPSPDSSEFRRRAVHLWLSDDPDTATAQTVSEMCREIKAANPRWMATIAAHAVEKFQGGPGFVGNAPRKLVDSQFWWVKHNLRFRHHGEQFEVWAGDLGPAQSKLQLLIQPDVLLAMGRMEGDCAIYTMMVCALLRALGVKYEIVCLAVDRSNPGVFSHVCACAVYPDGSREILDASHGAYPGWVVPTRDIQRMWVFDSEGRTMHKSKTFSGLHGYRRAGMGQEDSSVDLSSLYPAASGAYSGWDTSAPVASGGGGGGFLDILGSQLSAWTKIAGNVIAPQQTIARGPGGQLLITGPASSGTVGSSLLAAGSSSSLLWIVGGVIGVVVLASVLKK